MKHEVRTNEAHPFPITEATDPKNREAFVVEPLPRIDFAAAALRKAQAEYFDRYAPENGYNVVDPADLIWTIEKVDAE